METCTFYLPFLCQTAKILIVLIVQRNYDSLKTYLDFARRSLGNFPFHLNYQFPDGSHQLLRKKPPRAREQWRFRVIPQRFLVKNNPSLNSDARTGLLTTTTTSSEQTPVTFRVPGRQQCQQKSGHNNKACESWANSVGAEKTFRSCGAVEVTSREPALEWATTK